MEFYHGLTVRDFDTMKLGERDALIRHIATRARDAEKAARKQRR